jgi:hypothetical protein
VAGPGRDAQRADRWRFDAKDIVFDRLDLGQGRKTSQRCALTVGDHGGSGKGVIEQAAIGATGFDRPRAGRSEVAEARAASINAGERLDELGLQIRSTEIEFAARRIQQKLLPSQRRQTVTGGSDAVDQCPGIGR